MTNAVILILTKPFELLIMKISIFILEKHSSLSPKIYLFLERGEGRERNISVWLPLVHPLQGTWPANQA